MVAADTIVATATPFGVSGLAVVRISGHSALTIFSKVCGSKNNPCPEFIPRQATRVIIHTQGTPVDDAIATWFKAPRSYTGEDVVEISCHGSMAITEALVEEICTHGARIAEAGEFTRRAFLNGKLDLVQAESVAGLINSQSIESSKLNYRMLRGALSDKLHDLRNQIIELLAEVEFELDISEDDLNPDLAKKALAGLNHVATKLSNLIDTYRRGRLITRGANVVIAGPPNVGKSTLLNTLSSSDRALVSTSPGTTRDSIEVPLLIEGVPINLIDTAGLRESPENIERMGVRRTYKRLADADLVLFVLEPPYTSQKIGLNIPQNIPVIRVLNKIDTLSDSNNQKNTDKEIHISAKTGAGLYQLNKAIKLALHLSPSISSEVMLTTNRQQQSLSACRLSIAQATGLLSEKEIAFELVSIELHAAIDSIDSLLGKTTVDDIINLIFNKFCVGK